MLIRRIEQGRCLHDKRQVGTSGISLFLQLQKDDKYSNGFNLKLINKYRTMITLRLPLKSLLEDNNFNRKPIETDCREVT